MIVTLLTDFGLKDEYVGVMKGVILGIHPAARIVDLSHQVPAGDIARAGWLLDWSYPYFPAGTVHAAVVDPGVGTSRKVLCLEYASQFFLAPDNGLLSPLLRTIRSPRVREVSNRRYALSRISQTFHGRDIFAPAAAYLSKGVKPHRLGPSLRRFQTVSSPIPRKVAGEIRGRIIAVDRFGNAVTDLTDSLIRSFRTSGSRDPCVRVRRRRIHGISLNYQSVPAGRPLALIGSRGLLEISVHRGSAARTLGLRIGDLVRLS